ncbi:hypothetical protein HNR19_002626 [Nocardioides thalensis]|uniref:Uncharacterized protein n=1 Tax=Nocardioides thalensis TaxID=1914755 RepID=A0A853C624_9ACTN|nr:hypothetical protein [Nocardioides thalensis]
MQRDEDRDDAAWRAIVDNYGDRAELGPEHPAAPTRPEPEPSWDDDHDEPEPLHDPDDAFVPPPTPPIPRPPNDRLLAWIGIFGTPVLVVVLVALRITIPGWAGLLLAVAFVGGFLYLVTRSPRSPRDPWDDGARV